MVSINYVVHGADGDAGECLGKEYGEDWEELHDFEGFGLESVSFDVKKT